MDDKYLYLFLLIIKKDANIYNLATIKYDFAQLSRHLTKLKNDNIIEYFDGNLKLTKTGENFLIDLQKKLGYSGSDKWISPQIYYHKSKMSKEEIYLP